MKTIGVLALQGNFAMHMKAIHALGASAVEVRETCDLEKIDGLILPGGESTVMGKLLLRYGMIEPIKTFALAGRAVYGTCAGTILLSSDIKDYTQPTLALLDISVVRNAYGRQVESFEANIVAPLLGDVPLRGVFIRAPIISRLGEGIEIIAEYDGNAVFVRHQNIMTTTFHPELTDDLRTHEYFLSLV